MQQSLSVVVPAFDEHDNLEPSIDVLVRALTAVAADFEIIIVDDGSSDGTGDIADRLAAEDSHIRVVHHAQNMGLGCAYQHGVDVARKRYFMWIPGDNVCPEETLVSLFQSIGKADVVTPLITNARGRRFGRRIVSRAYTHVLNMLFGYRINTYNATTIYPLAFLKANPVGTYGYAFQAEALLRAMDQNLSVLEVPVTFHNPTGRSKAIRFKNIVSVAATVVRLYMELRIHPRLLGRSRARGTGEP